MTQQAHSDPDAFEVRSFHHVFALERRLHKVDRWRIPLPYGIPLRTLGYAALILLVVVAVGRLPMVGAAISAVPAPLRFVLGPALAAGLLSRLRPDGRAPHLAALGWLTYRLGPRTIATLRPVRAAGTVVRFTEAVVVLPDASASRYRPAVISGPARVLLRRPAAAQARRGQLRLVATHGAPLGRAREVRLADGQRLRIDRDPAPRADDRRL